jgi:hypothetical protein
MTVWSPSDGTKKVSPVDARCTWDEEGEDEYAAGGVVGDDDEPDDVEDAEAVGLPRGLPSWDDTGPGLSGSPVVVGRGGGERFGPVSEGGAMRR